MNRIRETALVIGLLGLAAPVRGQELKTDGVIKKDGAVVAALASLPGDRVVVAYVAKGVEGEKEKLKNWVEIRLLDVQSGKYRVLKRDTTPAVPPGMMPNLNLEGFTADGKQVVVSTTDPGGALANLFLDLPDFRDEPKKVEKGKEPKK